MSGGRLARPDTEPGQLIGLEHLPASAFLESLAVTVERAGTRRRLVHQGLREDATAHEARAVERDLIELLAWALRRLRASANANVISPAPVQALVLLPRNSILAHVLRRAVPIAALGIPVACSAPSAVRSELGRVIDLVAGSLALDGTLKLSPTDSPTSYARMPRSSMVVFTGRRSVLQRLAVKSGVEVVAATGRCSILVGADASAVSDVLHELCALQRLDSCTRPRAGFAIDGGWTTIRALGSPEQRSMSDALAGLRPSIVLSVSSEALPKGHEFVDGYRVLACGPHGESDTSVGLGRDPTFGWPGDYLI